VKFLQTVKDGGEESTVWAHVLFEIKPLCSVMLLRFEDGSREAYHTHAFNCFSWVLAGGGLLEKFVGGAQRYHGPSWLPFITKREHFHKVSSHGRTWVLTFRGPWQNSWFEQLADGTTIELTHGRRVLAAEAK